MVLPWKRDKFTWYQPNWCPPFFRKSGAICLPGISQTYLPTFPEKWGIIVRGIRHTKSGRLNLADTRQTYLPPLLPKSRRISLADTQQTNPPLLRKSWRIGLADTNTCPATRIWLNPLGWNVSTNHTTCPEWYQKSAEIVAKKCSERAFLIFGGTCKTFVFLTWAMNMRWVSFCEFRILSGICFWHCLGVLDQKLQKW